MTRFEGIAEKIGDQWRGSGSIITANGSNLDDTVFRSRMFGSFEEAVAVMWQWALAHGATELWVNGSMQPRTA